MDGSRPGDDPADEEWVTEHYARPWWQRVTQSGWWLAWCTFMVGAGAALVLGSEQPWGREWASRVGTALIVLAGGLSYVTATLREIGMVRQGYADRAELGVSLGVGLMVVGVFGYAVWGHPAFLIACVPAPVLVGWGAHAWRRRSRADWEDTTARILAMYPEGSPEHEELAQMMDRAGKPHSVIRHEAWLRLLRRGRER